MRIHGQMYLGVEPPVTIYLPHVRGNKPQAGDISLPKLYNGKAVVWREPPKSKTLERKSVSRPFVVCFFAEPLYREALCFLFLCVTYVLYRNRIYHRIGAAASALPHRQLKRYVYKLAIPRLENG